MKAVGVIGYKKSGKTTLGVRLAAELAKDGLAVGVIKHTHEGIDAPATDSAQYGRVADFVSLMADDGAAVFLKGEQKIDDVLRFFNGDVLIVEGFKDNKTFPKIVCLREESEKEDLCKGLEIATVSFKKEIADYDIMDDGGLRKLADLVMEKGFMLPPLDCGHCAYESCEELAKAIVAGKATDRECVSLNPPLTIKMGDKEIALNPFTASFCKTTILGMLSTLKGFQKGKITIEIP